MNRAIRIASIVALTTGLISLSVPVSAQTVYKSVDEQGNIVFTDRPPAMAKNDNLEAVEGLDIRRTDNLQVAAQNDQAGKQARAEDAVSDVREQEEGETAAILQQEAEERAANCKVAQARFKKYAEARRLYKSTSDGERDYLSSEEIDSAREKVALSVEEWCD